MIKFIRWLLFYVQFYRCQLISSRNENGLCRQMKIRYWKLSSRKDIMSHKQIKINRRLERGLKIPVTEEKRI